MASKAKKSADKPQYEMIIRWSDVDEAYVVFLPEFTSLNQPCTHGDTYEQAVRRARKIVESMIAIYREDGVPLPTPHKYSPAA